MTRASDVAVWADLLRALATGAIRYDDVRGVRGTPLTEGAVGACEVVSIERTPAGYYYLKLKAGGGELLPTPVLLKTFCNYYQDISLPDGLEANLHRKLPAGSRTEAEVAPAPPELCVASHRLAPPGSSRGSHSERLGAQATQPAKASHGGVPARLLGDMPRRPSERAFAERLLQLDFPADDTPCVWYPHLPGQRDVDAIVWAPSVGLFCIEVKAWRLDCIETLTNERFEVNRSCPHSTKTSPWEQADAAAMQFSDRLHRDADAWARLRHPWISAGVAMYNIRRARLLQKFEKVATKAMQREYLTLIAQSTIFTEDLESGDHLLTRLRAVRAHPVLRASPERDQRRVTPEEATGALDQVIRVFIRAASAVSAYDRARLRKLEEASTAPLEKVDWTTPVICSGPIGTGKTFLGLKAAVSYLEEAEKETGASALYLTFNKVLATDIRRLQSLSPRLRRRRLDVHDIYDLLGLVARRCGEEIQWGSREPDAVAAEWMGRNATSASLERMRGNWSMIVVDESQDMQDWMWQLVDSLRGANSRLLVIDGPGQLVYRRTRAAYLQTLVSDAEARGPRSSIPMSTVFRTTDATFLVSQLFGRTFPRVDAANDYWEDEIEPEYAKMERARGFAEPLLIRTLGLRLERPGASPPVLIPVVHQSTDKTASLLAVELTHVLASLRERDADTYPSDVLLLVPVSTKAETRTRQSIDWGEVARQMCLRADLAFIDYTRETERRRAFSPDEVRICTYHSSRGIEGAHTFVLGFDQLAIAAREKEWEMCDLGHIALSRSLYDTTVVYAADKRDCDSVRFLASVLDIVPAASALHCGTTLELTPRATAA